MKKRPVDFYCPRWGSEHLQWEDFFIDLKLAGYDGMEWAIDRETGQKELDEVFNLAERYKIKVIAQHYDTDESDFFRHIDLYAHWLERIRDYPLMKINSQTGKDYFNFSDNRTLIEMANDFGTDHAIEILHETHRSKFSFAAHVTKAYLEAIPRLLLTLDASHWVCVAESYLFDQREALDLAISRTGHIHARVGYPEGPQVTDPSLEIWEGALGVHLDWWDRAIARQQKHPDPSAISITTEFGPFPYMTRLPGGKDISSQWDINVWMLELLKNRYC